MSSALDNLAHGMFGHRASGGWIAIRIILGLLLFVAAVPRLTPTVFEGGGGWVDWLVLAGLAIGGLSLLFSGLYALAAKGKADNA